MKQHISEEQLAELTGDQKEKLRYLWIPKENDLAVAYICKNAKSMKYESIPFTVGKVEGDIVGQHYSIVLRSLRLIDDSFYEELDKPDDIVDELELEYRTPEDFFSFEYCLPLLNIGQMLEILSRNYFNSYDFFINYSDGNNNYGIGRRYSTYDEQNCEFESEELCDVLWEAVKALL